MATVNQPTFNPTNKLSAATVASAVVSVMGLVLKTKFPEWYDPEVLMAITPLIAFAAGYMVKDRANVE